MSTYKLGTTVRIPCTCERLNSSGTYEFFDPPSVAIVVKPSKSTTVVLSAVVHVATGSYYAEYLPPAADTYIYQCSFSGDVSGANDGMFTVSPSRV